MKTQTERQYLGQFAPVTGAQTRQTFEFPLGELWYAMYLRIAATLTVGASPVGAVAYEDPLLELINSIRLQTDRDGVLVQAPAKALYMAAWAKNGAAPNMDEASFAANTAAAYAMSVSIPIYFADYALLRPEDSALASDRYTTMDLHVGIGAGADVLSTAHSSGGGITLSALSVDVELEKYQGPIPDDMRPIVVQKIQMEGSPIDTSSVTNYPLTRSPRRAIKRLWGFASNLGVSSRAWSGNGHNGVLNTVQLESDQKAHDQNRRASQIRDANKLDFKLETLPTGLHVLDYVRGDGSVFSALSTGDKARLEVQITEAAAPPAGTRRLAVCAEAVEELAD